MTSQNVTARPTPATRDTATCEPGARVTRSLLGWGVVAGPLYVAVWLIQAMTRQGFDLRRHAASVLVNGDLGWIQVTNLIATGLMVLAAAVGVRRCLRSGRGRRWAPLLLGGYGAGMVLAGMFAADPMDGFPVGTPAGPAELSWHGALHYGFAGLAFVSLVAACLVLARRFGAEGRRGWARYSLITGIVFLAAWLAVASGATGAAFILALSLAIVLAWTWIAAVSVHLSRHCTGNAQP